MKIEKIRREEFEALPCRKTGRYPEIYHKLRLLPIGSYIRITLDAPDKLFPVRIQQSFRESRRHNYKFKYRKEGLTNKIWLFFKDKKRRAHG